MKFLSLFVAVLFCSSLFAQVTISSRSSANTSACAEPNSHCQAAFTGMSDSASGTYNAVPQHIGYGDMHSLQYAGATTDMYVHFMPWFCMQPGSTATGPGTLCNSHVQVGYNSNDPATVASQMADMQSRGFRGPIIDWYGPTAAVADSTTQLVKNELEGKCSGGTCPMSFAINEDQGSFLRAGCFQDGAGADQTDCILGALQSDLDYMNANYFPSPAYLRVDANTMKRSGSGRPVVFFFICETCFTNPSPNWSYIWNQLRAHVLSYSSGDPIMWFIFRNSGAYTHTQSDGAFSWINHYGSNDPYGLVYLDNFYDSSLKYPTLQTWGAVWKGFDNTNAAWKPSVSLTPQQCGNTWLQTFAEVTHNGDYGPNHQLPFLQVATWNDYDEGSEIETGIDNCLSLTTTVNDSSLSWVPSFSDPSGSEKTVDHYTVYGSTDGSTLTELATLSSGTHSVPLSSLNFSAGPQTLYVEAVGKPSISNHISPPVSYTPAITLSAISPSSGPTAGGTAVTISGGNINPQATVSIGGLSASVSSVAANSISVVTPAHAAGSADVIVTNPDGASATLAGAFKYVAPANITLAISPSSKTVSKGASATYSVSVAPQGGFTGIVKFVVTGLPTGATASFSPTSITTSGTTKLTIATKNSVRGTFTLSIQATSGTVVNTIKATLVVK